MSKTPQKDSVAGNLQFSRPRAILRKCRRHWHRSGTKREPPSLLSNLDSDTALTGLSNSHSSIVPATSRSAMTLEDDALPPFSPWFETSNMNNVHSEILQAGSNHSIIWEAQNRDPTLYSIEESLQDDHNPCTSNISLPYPQSFMLASEDVCANNPQDSQRSRLFNTSHQNYYLGDFKIESPTIPSIRVEPFEIAPSHSSRSPTSSQTVAATDGSIDTETSCIISDIETDWEEGENGRDFLYHEICKSNQEKQLRFTQIRRTRAQRLLEKPHKQMLIDSLMVDFYATFKGARTQFNSCNEGYDQSSHDSATGTISNDDQTKLDSAGAKRKFGVRRIPPGQEEEEEEGDRTPRCPKVLTKSSHEKLAGVKFACPYHQHNSRKYGIEDLSCAANYRTCAGPGWTSVARIKEHLYRRHRNPIRCSRCGTIFKTQVDLNNHLRIAVPCKVGPEEPMEGVTAEIEKRLKSRKRASPDQNEEDRWRAVYKILFPNEEIPSPYYESDSKLAAFEEYSRRETPLVFLTLLESRASTNQLTPEIRSELVDIVQECRIYIYRRYLQEVIQNARTSSDMNTGPMAGPPPFNYDSGLNQTGNTNPGAHSQPQANIEDPLGHNPLDYDPYALESLFQPEFQAESIFGPFGTSRCFCYGPCSCFPSPGFTL